MEKIVEVLLIFLQINQSENTLKHVFASLRLVLGKVCFRIYNSLSNCIIAFVMLSIFNLYLSVEFVLFQFI